MNRTVTRASSVSILKYTSKFMLTCHFSVLLVCSAKTGHRVLRSIWNNNFFLNGTNFFLLFLEQRHDLENHIGGTCF